MRFSIPKSWLWQPCWKSVGLSPLETRSTPLRKRKISRKHPLSYRIFLIKCRICPPSPAPAALTRKSLYCSPLPNSHGGLRGSASHRRISHLFCASTPWCRIISAAVYPLPSTFRWSAQRFAAQFRRYASSIPTISCAIKPSFRPPSTYTRSKVDPCPWNHSATNPSASLFYSSILLSPTAASQRCIYRWVPPHYFPDLFPGFR